MPSEPIAAAIQDAEPIVDLRVLAEYPLNDTGNASRLIARFGSQILNVDGHGWLAWDGRRFASGEAGEARAIIFAQETAGRIAEETLVLEAPAKTKSSAQEPRPKRKTSVLARLRSKRLSFSTASGNSGRVRAMLEMALPSLRRTAAELDRDPFKINTSNGTLLLQARNTPGDPFILQSHRRSDLLTKLTNVTFDPSAECPTFMAFLARIMPDPELRHFLQVWLGYCLTGNTSEQVIVICYGSGANGKSTLLDVIRFILGEYVAMLPVETLLEG
ncbi:MAG TPA: hypothetical protein PLO50_14750, partial [Nitrospira sp.]|nr:hypothetical protein [Nitrospira sp.]